MFAPQVYSVEAFVEEIAGIGYATHSQQLFHLYEIYQKRNGENAESFSVFCKWATTVLQDFNEIDRHLIVPKKVFTYLADIQEINHWSLRGERTELIEEYIKFWEGLEDLYHGFVSSLLDAGIGHQGLVYRVATHKLGTYIEKTKTKKHIFVGFNALNAAEKSIIQQILERSHSQIYWDIDSCFINDPIHDAGYFIRDYYKDRANRGLVGSTIGEDHYLHPKEITIIGVPKNVSQAKYVGNLLGELHKGNPGFINHTAVVLGDENLLNPLLHAIPAGIAQVNITMGSPLGNSSLATIFGQLLDLHLNWTERGWNYKAVLLLLAHPYVRLLLEWKTGGMDLGGEIRKRNWQYITKEYITGLNTDIQGQLDMLFLDSPPSPIGFIEQCLQISKALKARFSDGLRPLELEQLYRFHTLFQELKEMVLHYDFIRDLRSVESLYKELLSAEKLDFQGEPLVGLQIMGMLESRNLDFETVIITSVNEGILPSGKSNNSFIPFDVKRTLGLPTYRENDAVYTYHFYRLLQRAKTIYILYNTEPDVLEGREKSRLIHQLLTDGNLVGSITEIIATPAIPAINSSLETIPKDEQLMERIKEVARSGFSPSSLSNYIRNPMDFYKRTILKIGDAAIVEETLAYTTFGTIVHDTLETLYLPFVGHFLEPGKLLALKPEIKEVVKSQFNKTFSDLAISRGKNLIAFNVVIRYIENFIDLEIEEAGKHRIKILGLERKMAITLDLPEIGFPIVLKGKLDRVDQINGVTRILDYKTGSVTASQVQIVDWNDLVSNYDQSKAFQLLCYSLMYDVSNSETGMLAGILSFKNLRSGPFMFGIKEKRGSRMVENTITKEILLSFYNTLKELILELCDPAIAFTERKIS